MRVVAVVNQKGGVGKTTTTMNLGVALAARLQRVLVLDLDPQASLTTAFGLDPEAIDATIYNVFDAAIHDRPRPQLFDILVHREGVALAPANLTLSAVDMDLVNAMSGEFFLREMLQPLANQYDWALIDCLPNLGLLTINALVAAGEVLIPLQTEFLPMKGLRLLLHTIQRVQSRLNPQLTISGVLPTMVEPRTLHSREVLQSVRSVFEGKVPIFETQIKRSVKLKECTVAGQSILAYAPTSDAADAYRNLAKEMDHGKASTGHPGNSRPDVRRRTGSAHGAKVGATGV